jgi:uncharacterized repeat protein (TIGR01451 family)
MISRSALVLAAVLLSTPMPLLAQAPTCFAGTGTYSTGDGTDGNQATGSGPWTLTATDSTFSYVTYTPSTAYTFAQLQHLSATFDSIAGGAGGGSPRLSVRLDVNNSGVADSGDASVLILFGNAPDFIDTDTELDAWSGVNLIGNMDNGRYDTSQFAGGSPYTDYANALALAGAYRVLSITMIEDTFGEFPDRNLVLTSINTCAEGADLVVTKTQTGGTIEPGGSVTWDIVVTNQGSVATTGTVTVIDTPSEGITITSLSGSGWSCNVGTLTCTRGDALAAGASYPPINVAGTIDAGASGPQENRASVGGGGDVNPGNNSSAAAVPLGFLPVPALDARALLVLALALGAFGLRRIIS